MTWWQVSSPEMTCAVEVKSGIVTDAPPILRRFIGQPSKQLGNWMRAMGDFTYERLEDAPAVEFPWLYTWGNNEKRATLKGRHCRIVSRGERRSVMVEFEDGQREIVSFRALRKENP